jgi:hypothetical protein
MLNTYRGFQATYARDGLPLGGHFDREGLEMDQFEWRNTEWYDSASRGGERRGGESQGVIPENVTGAHEGEKIQEGKQTWAKCLEVHFEEWNNSPEAGDMAVTPSRRVTTYRVRHLTDFRVRKPETRQPGNSPLSRVHKVFEQLLYSPRPFRMVSRDWTPSFRFHGRYSMRFLQVCQV